jgi:hypothetical protein
MSAKNFLKAFKMMDEIDKNNKATIQSIENINKSNDKMFEFAQTQMEWANEFARDLRVAKSMGADDTQLMNGVVWPMLVELKERLDKI